MTEQRRFSMVGINGYRCVAQQLTSGRWANLSPAFPEDWGISEQALSERRSLVLAAYGELLRQGELVIEVPW